MAKEIMALKGMVAELHPPNSIHSMSDKASIVCVDNKATVDLLLEPKNQEKSRHWLIAYWQMGVGTAKIWNIEVQTHLWQPQRE